MSKTGPDTGSLPPLGAHMSIAGGLHNAIADGAKHRCDAIQIFTKSSNQWAAKTLTEENVELFRDAAADLRKKLGRLELAAHDSYLINLASPEPPLLKRSREAFLIEVERCELLGIPRLVFHPGAHKGLGDDHGIRNIVESLDWVFSKAPEGRTKILLETTAGMGTSIGWRFEHMARIIENVKENHRLGICFDTCHVLAAGYDYRDEEGYAEVVGEFDRLIGVERLQLFHLNDSKKDLNSHLDRHEHIGKGFVGNKAFARILQDPRFRDVPMVLETPKTDDMDRWNLALLRRLGRPASR